MMSRWQRKADKMSSTIVSIVVVLFFAYWGLGTILYIMQSSFLYKPFGEIVYTPDELGLDFEDLTIKTVDGLAINAWYIPAKDAEFTILFCHGNGGNIMHRLDSINLFNQFGLNCLIFDYRGYGNSEGKPSEEGTYRDAMAAYKWLTEEKKICQDDIIFFGRSIGASVATRLASEVGSLSLVIESAFTSYVDMGKKFYPYMPVKWFAKFNYNTLEYIKNVRCPIMIIHSRDDEIVPFEFGLQLHEASGKLSEFVEIYGTHNDGFLVSGKIYKQAWLKWLKSLMEHRKKDDHQQAS